MSRRVLDPRRAFRCLVGREAMAVAPLGGGANSRVWRVEEGDGRRWLLKHYGLADQDCRDRLQREYGAFRWLRDHGVKEVPEPLASDPERGNALYEFIDGTPPKMAEIGPAEVDAAVAFLGRLRELAPHAPAHLPPATEACFSVADVAAAISGRLERMEEAMGDHGLEGELRSLLDGRFRPAFEQALARAGAESDAPLAAGLRMPSPADFGFHNALRNGDRRLRFLDFEYFGWDDPAKCCADFLLHPAMALDEPLKRRFHAGMAVRFGDDPGFASRVRRIYPLHGLKWCLIVLNVFTRPGLARRRLAGRGGADPLPLLRRQLQRAAALLDAFDQANGEFPYA